MKPARSLTFSVKLTVEHQHIKVFKVDRGSCTPPRARIGLTLAVTMTVAFSALTVTAQCAEPDPWEGFWRSTFQRPAATDTKRGALEQTRQALGRDLFVDRRLSGSETRSCASCHVPGRSFTDGQKIARAAPKSSVLLRNTPTLYGLANAQSFNWDGSATSLEHQALGPITGAGELAGRFDVIIARLTDDQSLVRNFKRAFPKERPAVTQKTIASALAAYVRSLEPPRTRFDDWVDGDDSALSLAEKRGLRVFVGKAGCIACHSGWRFTDDSFHDIGLNFDGETEKTTAGRVGVRAFKTPTLRAVRHTAPYMHDGRFLSLSAVVDHYSRRVRKRPGLSLHLPANINLTKAERNALVVFLKTL